MKLIFAQGNPGSDYDRTRHNVGFNLLDFIAAEHSISFQPKDKFKALVAEFQSNSEKILLAKPATYYNETGLSARAIIDFYKLDPSVDVLVIHDELALPFGTVRLRGQGSDAGNNGIKSLNAQLRPQYHRLRIGIGSDQRAVMGDSDFVLGRFTTRELTTLSESIMPTCRQLVADFINGQREPVSHRAIEATS